MQATDLGVQLRIWIPEFSVCIPEQEQNEGFTLTDFSECPSAARRRHRVHFVHRSSFLQLMDKTG